MWVHDLSPVLLQLGPIAIRYYSLAYILGAVATYLWLRWLVAKKHIDFLDKDKIESLVLYAMIGVIVGGRLGYVLFYNPSMLLDPLSILMVWQGGMAFHGGLLGVVVAGLYFSHKYKIHIYKIGDLLFVPAAFGLFLGRVANFINAELVGTPFNGAWCVVFPQTDEVCRHPSQLYEAAKNLVIFVVLIPLTLAKKGTGIPTWTFVFLYGILRFSVNFVRDDPATFWILSTGQVLSLGMAILGLCMLLYCYKQIKLPDAPQKKKALAT